MSQKAPMPWAVGFVVGFWACSIWRSCRSGLEREYDLDLITSAPTVVYEVLTKK